MTCDRSRKFPTLFKNQLNYLLLDPPPSFRLHTDVCNSVLLRCSIHRPDRPTFSLSDSSTPKPQPTRHSNNLLPQPISSQMAAVAAAEIAILNKTRIPHPYYPLDVEIVGYLVNEWSVPYMMALWFSGCGVLMWAGTWLLTRWKPSLRGTEKATALWFLLCESYNTLVLKGSGGEWWDIWGTSKETWSRESWSKETLAMILSGGAERTKVLMYDYSWLHSSFLRR